MNKVILIGNLTKDVELRETNSGKKVASISIAVSRPYSEESDFFNLTIWDKRAENCAKYLSKGKKVAVEGYVFNHSYEDKDGNKRQVTEINVQEIEFLSPKQEESAVQTTIRKRGLEEINDLPF
jgi:single-strand DNA-binding protein